MTTLAILRIVRFLILFVCVSFLLYVCSLQTFCGELLACIRTKTGQNTCFIHPLECLYVCNEYDCPLLLLWNQTIRCIHAECVISSMSVMHECSDTCTVSVQSYSRAVERQLEKDHHLTFQHDYSKTLFSLNVYCLNSCDFDWISLYVMIIC